MKVKEVYKILLELIGIILLLMISLFTFIWVAMFNSILIVIISILIFSLTVYQLIKILPDIIRLKRYIMEDNDI